ncbi:MAG: hypothetical protein K2X60_07225 [Xanthobacteraceae bacterium]|nr:hypothetical protein [Xanthobacteraceae bacterium]
MIAPTEYIARGFFLNTTSQKDHMDLWKVVTPLFRPIEFFHLTYGQILAENTLGRIYINTKAFNESAALVFAKIKDHAASLRQLQKPSDFLRYISWMSGNATFNVRVDFGLAHYLAGNIREARKIFRELKSDLDELGAESVHHLAPLIIIVGSQLETDPSGLLAIINEWRNQNIETLCLGASCTSSARLRLVE